MANNGMQQRVAGRWLSASPVREVDRSKTYYHGTPRASSAQAILRDGVIKPPDVVSKAFLAPVKGRVYMTPTLSYAAIYAMGGAMAGHTWPPEHIKAEPLGYLFSIAGKDLLDIQPDEDSIGELLFEGDAPSWLVALGRRHLSKTVWQKGQQGEYMYYAKAGKTLLGHMSDDQKLALVDMGAHIAASAEVPFQHCWEFPKNRSQDLEKDGSNFFSLCRQIR